MRSRSAERPPAAAPFSARSLALLPAHRVRPRASREALLLPSLPPFLAAPAAICPQTSCCFRPFYSPRRTRCPSAPPTRASNAGMTEPKAGCRRRQCPGPRRQTRVRAGQGNRVSPAHRRAQGPGGRPASRRGRPDPTPEPRRAWAPLGSRATGQVVTSALQLLEGHRVTAGAFPAKAGRGGGAARQRPPQDPAPPPARPPPAQPASTTRTPSRSALEAGPERPQRLRPRGPERRPGRARGQDESDPGHARTPAAPGAASRRPDAGRAGTAVSVSEQRATQPAQRVPRGASRTPTAAPRRTARTWLRSRRGPRRSGTPEGRRPGSRAQNPGPPRAPDTRREPRTPAAPRATTPGRPPQRRIAGPAAPAPPRAVPRASRTAYLPPCRAGPAAASREVRGALGAARAGGRGSRESLGRGRGARGEAGAGAGGARGRCARTARGCLSSASALEAGASARVNGLGRDCGPAGPCQVDMASDTCTEPAGGRSGGGRAAFTARVLPGS